MLVSMHMRASVWWLLHSRCSWFVPTTPWGISCRRWIIGPHALKIPAQRGFLSQPVFLHPPHSLSALAKLLCPFNFDCSAMFSEWFKCARLDLFCGWRYRYLMMISLMAPALCAGLAIHLAAARTNNGKGGIRPCDQVVPAWLPWFLAIVACAGHACLLAVVLFVCLCWIGRRVSVLPRTLNEIET